MTPLTPEKIQELKATHKELICIELPTGEQLVFRKPKRLEFDLWSDSREKGSQAGRELAQTCLVYPTNQEFMAVLEENAGILMCKNGVVDSITDMAGADGSALTAKKL